MYTTRNFATKKELKHAVQRYHCWQMARENTNSTSEAVLQPAYEKLCRELKVEPGQGYPNPVRLYAPGLGSPATNGTEFVEGPHYPQPHKWYAQVTVQDGIVVSVK